MAGDVTPEDATIGVVGDPGDSLGGPARAVDLDGDGIAALLTSSVRGIDVFRGPIDTLLTPAEVDRVWIPPARENYTSFRASGGATAVGYGCGGGSDVPVLLLPPPLS